MSHRTLSLLLFRISAEGWRWYSGGRGRQISEFKDSLVYIVSSKTSRKGGGAGEKERKESSQGRQSATSSTHSTCCITSSESPLVTVTRYHSLETSSNWV